MGNQKPEGQAIEKTKRKGTQKKQTKKTFD